MEGTTATHCADLRISSGTPLSGADMISLSTVEASLSLPTASSWEFFAKAETDVQISSARTNNLFMNTSECDAGRLSEELRRGVGQKDAGLRLATLVTSSSPDSHIWWLLLKIMMRQAQTAKM